MAKQTPYEFFLEHAGYGWHPEWETPEHGQRRNAQRLAIAERRATMLAECDGFIADNWALIQETGQSAEQCGHDLWLTRNGHGVGFWDRGYPVALGDALTRAARLAGERDLYLGDDGRIWQS